MELFRDDKIHIEGYRSADAEELSLRVKVDFSELELYKWQIRELTEHNGRLLDALEKSEQQKAGVNVEARHQSEYVSVNVQVAEVEVQTDNCLEQLEERLRKGELDKGELAKELSSVRKNLLDSQKQKVREKELSQQTYSNLVEKYESDSARLTRDIEHLNSVVK